jgi:hypothetical protein
LLVESNGRVVFAPEVPGVPGLSGPNRRINHPINFAQAFIRRAGGDEGAVLRTGLLTPSPIQVREAIITLYLAGT